MKSSKPKYTVYKTINLVNNMFYIGVHRTNNLYDDYLGSGLLIEKAIRKYGRHNFTKEILYVFDTKDAAYAKESEIVTKAFIKSNRNICYNRAPGGCGGYLGEEAINKMRKSKLGKPPWNKGLYKPAYCKKCNTQLSSNKYKHCQACSYEGTNNPSWKGFYKTPNGTFNTLKEAAKSHKFSPQTLKRRIESHKYPDFIFISK